MVKRPGVTLLELLLASALMSIGILGMIGAFRYFNVGVQSAKTRSLANNIAQEKVEFLKNRSYYRILVTTSAASDPNFPAGQMTYDAAPNGQETVNVGGLNFIRRVHIRKVSEDPARNLQYLAWDAPDPGLKEIKVYVVWHERGEWRKLEVRNLRENPDRANLSAAFSGRVTDLSSGVGVSSAVVRAQENPARYAYTDSNGAWSFDIEPGSYTLLAAKESWFTRIRPAEHIAKNANLAGRDFALTRMSSGTVTGAAYRRDRLVISQIVGSSMNLAGQSQEWVEVYNPTTWTWLMASGLGTGTNEIITFTYTEAGAGALFPDMDYRRLSLAPGAYYLFANTGTINAGGVSRAADAVYDVNANFGDLDDVINTGSPSSAGCVVLRDTTTAVAFDVVGWDANSNATAAKKTTGCREGQAIVRDNGLRGEEAFTRYTSPAGVTDGRGRCYDSNNNNADFEASVPLIRAPRNSSVSEPCVSGAPAAGAVVFAADGLSAAVTADASGYFNLRSVATGYWTVYASSGNVMLSTGLIGGLSNGFVHAAGFLLMSSPTVYGYVSGRVLDVGGNPLSGVKIYAGGSPDYTGADGRYCVTAPAGETIVFANHQSYNPSYVEASSAGVIVPLGGAVPGVNFTLPQGGRLRGRITTNGVDPLPDVPVSALRDGVERGSGISGADGYFLIAGAGISTGTYTVVPRLEAGESATPSSTTVTVQAGLTAFTSTYTVSGAFGYVEGSVTAGGGRITTGVLVYVTTATLAAGAGPPDITPALRAGGAVYYAASSSALGVYSVPARGGSYNVYAWYTAWSGGVPATARREAPGVAVQPNQTTAVNFAW